MVPRRLRINGRVWQITTTVDDPEAVGLAYKDKGLICVTPGADSFATKDTLLHEVMHAVRYMQGREDGGEVEEDYVRSLATGILGVLRDNPTFAKWLIAK